MAKGVAKFYTAASNEHATKRDQQNWNGISTYDTISPFLKNLNLPESSKGMDVWLREQLRAIYGEPWEPTRRFKRKVHAGPKLPPVYTESLSVAAHAMATKWYLNCIKGSSKLSELGLELEELLSKGNLREEQAKILEVKLLSLIRTKSRKRIRKRKYDR